MLKVIVATGMIAGFVDEQIGGGIHRFHQILIECLQHSPDLIKWITLLSVSFQKVTLEEVHDKSCKTSTDILLYVILRHQGFPRHA